MLRMGLVTRRSLQLDKLFEQLAVDPKKAKKQPKDSKDQTKDKDEQTNDNQK